MLSRRATCDVVAKALDRIDPAPRHRLGGIEAGVDGTIVHQDRAGAAFALAAAILGTGQVEAAQGVEEAVPSA